MDILGTPLDILEIPDIEKNQRFFLKSLDVNTDDIVRPVTLQNKTDEALSPLSPRQREVVILRNGLDGGRRYSLQVIGDSEGVTRERIRQIEARAMKKLQLKR
jgi:RNA polymerase primary sigma factor